MANKKKLSGQRAARASRPPRLRDILNQPNQLTLAERRRIVEQAIALLEGVYVHRPQKEAMHAINPLQRLRLLRDEIEHTRADLPVEELPMRDIDFHRLMVDIFTSLRDLHTAYLLPQPYNQYLVFLPFLLESCLDKGVEKFIVTKLVGPKADRAFIPGVEVLYWNGIRIRRAIELNGEQQAGGNPDARFAQGLLRMTMRPLARSLPPDEKWVTVTYRTPGEKVREAKFEWRVMNLAAPAAASGELSGMARYRAASIFGIDIQAALIGDARKQFFAKKWVKAERAVVRTRARPQVRAIQRLAHESGYLPTELPTVFRAYPLPESRYGYLRIFSFDVTSPDGFIDACRSLLARLPQDGLILDIRGNPGGNILAAEKLLQLFTPRRIQPARMQFINTRLTLALCERHRETAQPGLTLGLWADSIRESVQTGAPYSTGFPMTPESDANEVGQQYYGPVVLITDPLCYSATDIFAAGFQDHGIGEILGVGGRTGAGGANVWQHSLVEALMRGIPGSPFALLPRDTGMTVSIRRCLRVGDNADLLLEDFGVVPDGLPYRMTRRDLLSGNTDLIAEAVRRLDYLSQVHPSRVLKLTDVVVQGNQLSFTLATRNLVRVDVWVDNRPLQSYNVIDERRPRTAPLTLATPRRVKALGFASYNAPEPVALARVRI